MLSSIFTGKSSNMVDKKTAANPIQYSFTEEVTFGVSNMMITPDTKNAALPSNVLFDIKCLPQFFPMIAADESQNITTNIEVIATGLGKNNTHKKNAMTMYVPPVKTCLSY